MAPWLALNSLSSLVSALPVLGFAVCTVHPAHVNLNRADAPTVLTLHLTRNPDAKLTEAISEPSRNNRVLSVKAPQMKIVH